MEVGRKGRRRETGACWGRGGEQECSGAHRPGCGLSKPRRPVLVHGSEGTVHPAHPLLKPSCLPGRPYSIFTPPCAPHVDTRSLPLLGPPPWVPSDLIKISFISWRPLKKVPLPGSCGACSWKFLEPLLAPPLSENPPHFPPTAGLWGGWGAPRGRHSWTPHPSAPHRTALWQYVLNE